MRSPASVVLLSLLAAGCSSSSGLFGSGSAPSTAVATGAPGAGDFTDSFANLFATGARSRPPAGPAAAAAEQVDCPQVAVREGAATLAIHAAGEPSPLNLRYQGSIGRIARECHVVGRTVRMKVGMEGRLIVGPVGGPGKVDVPLRFAVVREGPQPQTIVTKTYRVQVPVEAGAASVPFMQIDEDLAFPLPPVGEIEAYEVYVGFDPEALKRPEPRRRKASPRRRG
jgi:hypothetical protein